MNDEYRQKELEFLQRQDSLCEDIRIDLCDCSQCPTRDLCNWLCEHDPNIGR